MRLVKGRATNLVKAIDLLDEQVSTEDQARIAKYYALHFRNLETSCLADSELPELASMKGP